MSYLVLARKYRPKTFEEVVGQGPISTTLKNVLERDRVAHAYLFAGPRGVGKTSMARILAKALNCGKGVSTEPCNRCSICLSIATGEDVDVIELDGASNRGIDEIRSIRENVRYAPSRARFKIYIIDEVHMLTKEAFNALLKTLEEPPSHVKFVLATTQPEKIPATILSRCQRFDFRRLSLSDMVGKLEEICQREKTPVSRDVLHEIARHSEGGMRDSISLLDQILSFCEGPPSLEDLHQMLGTAPWVNLADLVDALLAKDQGAVLNRVNDLYMRGRDPGEFLGQLIEYFRGLMVLGSCPGGGNLLDEPPPKLARMNEQAKVLSLDHCLYAFSVLNQTLGNLRRMDEGRILLEMALMKLLRMREILTLDDLADTLRQMEGMSCRSFPISPEKRPLSPGPSPPEGGAPGKQDEEKEATSEEGPPGEMQGQGAASEEEEWKGVVQEVKRRKASLGNFLIRGMLRRAEKSCLHIGFPKGSSFFRNVLEEPQNTKIIEEAVKKVWGKRYRVVFEEEPGECFEENAKKDDNKRSPQVDLALKIFEGRILRWEKKS